MSSRPGISPANCVEPALGCRMTGAHCACWRVCRPRAPTSRGAPGGRSPCPLSRGPAACDTDAVACLPVICPGTTADGRSDLRWRSQTVISSESGTRRPVVSLIRPRKVGRSRHARSRRRSCDAGRSRRPAPSCEMPRRTRSSHIARGKAAMCRSCVPMRHVTHRERYEQRRTGADSPQSDSRDDGTWVCHVTHRRKSADLQALPPDGETRTRTGDTTIFSQRRGRGRLARFPGTCLS
jgi:hypothetical protein